MILATATLGSILVLMLILAGIGALAWAVTSFIPMPQPIKAIIIVFAVIIAIILLLQSLGVWDSGIPRLDAR